MTTTNALTILLANIAFGIAAWREVSKARKELAAWRNAYPDRCYARDDDRITAKIAGAD